MVESESGDKGESNNGPTVVPEENNDEGQSANKLVEQPTVQINDEEVQVITSPLKD